MDIGALIHHRRLELGLTLEDVAQRVGVGRSTVRKWEQGMIKNMRRDKIAALANILQLDPILFVTPPVEMEFDKLPVIEAQGDRWEESLIRAYKDAGEHTQEHVCKLLDIEHVKPE